MSKGWAETKAIEGETRDLLTPIISATNRLTRKSHILGEGMGGRERGEFVGVGIKMDLEGFLTIA